MNQSNVRGFLGELYVKEKLESEGCEVTHFGNQSGIDLEIVGKNIRIDVKFSSLRNPHSWDANWGWALKSLSKRKISCTHFICVAADENYDVNSYYVVKSECISLFPQATGQYKNVQHSFLLQQNTKNLIDLEDYSRCRNLITEGLVIRVEPNGSLIQALGIVKSSLRY